MSDLMRDLYQEIILEHYKNPRNFGVLEGEVQQAEGHNPICGDRIRVFLKVVDGIVESVMFDGKGCAICMSTASLMTESIKGLTVASVLSKFESIHSMLTGDFKAELHSDNEDFALIAGVREFPIRVKCATLPWHALKAALGNEPSISTE